VYSYPTDAKFSLEASIREDVALVKSNPFFQKDLEVIGFKHDVASGEVTEVV